MNTHKFDVEDAKKHGIEKAILLEHLKFHQQANKGNDDLTFEGKTYAFLKPSTIKEMYPYMNYASIRRWLKELEEDGVIESIKPKARGGYHLKYYHVFPIAQNDHSIDQAEHSLIDQNDHSSIVTNVKRLPNEKGDSDNYLKIPKGCEGIDGFEEMWKMFQDHRKDLGKPITEHALTLLENKLLEFNDPVKSLEESIANGWTGVFNTNKSNNGRTNSNKGHAETSTYTRDDLYLADL